MNPDTEPAPSTARRGRRCRPRAEEFLYLACLHEGTGVGEARLPRRRRRRGGPDRPRAADAERRRRAAPLRLEPLQLCLPRARPLAPDRAGLPLVAHPRRQRADDPRRPRIEKVIEPEEVVRETGYTRPHTSTACPATTSSSAMLGDADGNGAGGFAVLDAQTFEVKGRWENGGETPSVQLRLLVPAAQERARLVRVGRAERLRAGLRPRRRRRRAATAAGSTSGTSASDGSSRRSTSARPGLVPLEVRWLHDPDAEQGFVGAALSSTMWHFHRENGGWDADQVIAVESVELEGWPFPVPGLITDLVLSMDDRFLYFSNWLHGDLRQYDVSDPANPKLTGQLWLGGVLGKPSDAGPRAERRAADAPALLRRAAPVRHELALLDLGQPVLPGAALLAAAGRTATRTAAWRSTATSSSTSTTARRSRARARGAPPERRLHDGDLPVILAHHGGELPLLQAALASAGALPLLLLLLRAHSPARPRLRRRTACERRRDRRS